MKKRNERVIFYSESDVTVGHELKKIQNLLEAINKNDFFDVNDFLEFYSIKKYFDSELFLTTWNEKMRKNYIELSNNLFKKTAQYFNQKINSTNLSEILDIVELYYDKLFYELFSRFKLFKGIEASLIIDKLNKTSYVIEYLLKYKDIVNYYSDDITFFLESYDKTTELLLDKTEGTELYFPDSLTCEIKETLVLKYLANCGRENINKVENISKLQNNDFLKISGRTKLLAKKKYDDLVEKVFQGNSNFITESITVGFSEKQKEDILIESKNAFEHKITYSVNLFNQLYNCDGLSYLFRKYFGYVDSRGNVGLVNKKSQTSSIMELFSNYSPGEYKTGSSFGFNKNLGVLNLQTLFNYLSEYHNKNFTYIFEYFIGNLKLYNGFEKIIFRSNSVDKIEDYSDILKIIIPESDLMIKQFICYSEEGVIDFELIRLQDGFKYENIPSLLKDKYFYEKDEKLQELKYHFFSDQSGLFYIPGYERKYKNFYSLISKENLRLNNFDNYQIKILNILIKEKILFINEESYIKIKNKTFIFLVGEIYGKEVISYDGYNSETQFEILEMKKLGYLWTESTLLSHLESDFFNYYLKDNFPNSEGIRNKNMHGFFYLDKNTEYNDFLIVMKLVILIFLKIEDELLIIDKQRKI